MTTFQLFLWIAAGALLQVALFLFISFWRHWSNFLYLKQKLAISTTPTVPQSAQEASTAHPTHIAAWKGIRNFRVERKVLEDSAGQVCSIYLIPEDGQPLQPFLPGQFLTFKLEIDTKGQGLKPVTRCYSLSDSPNEKYYRITVKRLTSPDPSRVAPGVSSNYIHDHVKVAAVLKALAPAGQFYMNANSEPVVLIGGGIGITPMISMLKWIFEHQPDRETWLFYGVRNTSELAMTSQLLEFARVHYTFQLHLCLSDPHAIEPDALELPFVHLHHVRADIQLLRRLLPLKAYAFYICGPSAMLQSLVPALEDWGVPQERIHFEAFGPASISRAIKAPSSRVSTSLIQAPAKLEINFSKSNKSAQWTSEMGSLLDFAEEQGISVPSSCRSGVCGTCQTKLSKGQVTYNTEALFEIEAGCCLLCISTPTTDISLEI